MILFIVSDMALQFPNDSMDVSFAKPLPIPLSSRLSFVNVIRWSFLQCR